MQLSQQKSLILISMIGFFALLVFSGCAPTLTGKEAILYHDDHISVDTVWSGNIVIDGTVKVAKGATLTISPGRSSWKRTG